MKIICLLTAATVLSIGSASAGEVLIGLGYDDAVRGRSASIAAEIEVRSEPVWTYGSFGVRGGAAVEVDADADFWAGAGIIATYDLTQDLRLEGSFMPGYYAASDDGTNLGHKLEFRSQAAISYQIMEGKRVGLAFEHKSNANIGTKNPGIETAFVTLSSTF
ncbi:acyloxyacyl hydrolase [Pseudovibrio sp. Tun.PSC04-5.I4]|uniref:acyloxyacyl hydrolase n=1 Tax=Pseudovibrio sp. Tun.PSC04-5.I4 TaxID=1798213 RepID=UPI000891E18B|nr:acyloxyacyl hydrolase [Pseudovibrio sp. Tun.PSC04-5.I4]SDQ73168.1 Lipid A 3-O-deacylase (PagL) [Pseudovibrio sp. Tun.PSC04-5.I4]